MTLSLQEAIAASGCLYAKMLVDGRSVGLVAYIGGTPPELGAFFAGRFECESIALPSTGTHRQFDRSTRLANVVYRHFPEAFRRPVSWAYRGMRVTHETTYPEHSLSDSAWRSNGLPVLLVDDSCFTGGTFNFWKNQIKRELARDAITCSITAIGKYLPDYYCTRKWRSFAWRPVGV